MDNIKKYTLVIVLEKYAMGTTTYSCRFWELGKSNVSSQGVCVVNLCLLLNDAHLYANCSGVGEGVKADPGSL